MTTLSNFILFARGGGGGEIPESYLQSSAKFSRGGGGVATPNSFIYTCTHLNSSLKNMNLEVLFQYYSTLSLTISRF